MNVDSLEVVQYPHPALRWVSKPVPEVNSLVRDVAKKMIDLMHDHRGVGLAANQVAVPWRIFVTCVNDKDLVFINPEVHLGRNKRDSNPAFVEEPEGCLSFPGLMLGEGVRRARDVYVSALDVNGKPFAISGPGLLAKAVQHENDHLDGVLFIDHLKLSGEIQYGEEPIPVKKYFEGWLNYLTVQHDFLVKCGKYGTDEEEKKKLTGLEELLEESCTSKAAS